MFVLLLIYFIIIFFFVIFNIYGISRLVSMRIKGDFTGMAIFIYSLVIAIVILTSILYISFLDWPINFKGLL